MIAIAFGVLVETWIGDDTVELRCAVCGQKIHSCDSPVDLAELLRVAAAHVGPVCVRVQEAGELPEVSP